MNLIIYKFSIEGNAEASSNPTARTARKERGKVIRSSAINGL